jgi:drug/metabolite transporter (DMT)-like permease
MQLALSVVMLASAWPLTKNAISAGASPLWFAVARAGLSGLTAFGMLGLTRRLKWPVRGDGPALLAVGLLQIAGFFGLAHAAAAWVPAGRTALLANVTTVWMVPLSILVLHEAIPPRRWLAACFGLGGVAVLTGPWAIDWTSPTVLLGHSLLLGAALSWSAAIVVIRRCPPRSSMLTLLPWSFALATAALLPIAAWTQPGPGHWGIPALSAAAYIGCIAGPIGTWCIMQVTSSLPSMVSSIGFLASPALGLLLSAWWLGERLTPDLLIGAALIMVGVVILAWPSAAPAEARA